MRFVDQVAVVTGGASGIGLAIGEAFGREGAHVVIADVDAARGHEAASRVRQQGGSAHAVAVDVGDREQVRAMFAETIRELGRVDILVTSAGIGRRGAFLDHLEQDWHDVVRVNLTGAFFCGQAAARQMVERGAGRIVNIASINGFRGVAEAVGYNATKAGVVSLTKTMAVELARHGITVNAIAPAQIDTPLLVGLAKDRRQLQLQRIPLDRFGRPEDVAAAATFLASADADYITGHVPAVDGGYLAGGSWTTGRAER